MPRTKKNMNASLKVKAPGSKKSIDRMKYEIANEFGVNLGASASSRDNGMVGGEITKRLIESGNDNLLFEKDSIDISCPIVLIQGMKDTSVDWHRALMIAERVKTEEVMVKLLKNSGHRLNEDFEIKEILSGLDTFL